MFVEDRVVIVNFRICRPKIQGVLVMFGRFVQFATAGKQVCKPVMGVDKAGPQADGFDHVMLRSIHPAEIFQQVSVIVMGLGIVGPKP